LTTTDCWKEWPWPWHLHRSDPHRASSAHCNAPSPHCARALPRGRSVESIGRMTVWRTSLRRCHRLLHRAPGRRGVDGCVEPSWSFFPRPHVTGISPGRRVTCSKPVTKKLLTRQTECGVAVEASHRTCAAVSDAVQRAVTAQDPRETCLPISFMRAVNRHDTSPVVFSPGGQN
jgi:hypothetical protein